MTSQSTIINKICNTILTISVIMIQEIRPLVFSSLFVRPKGLPLYEGKLLFEFFCCCCKYFNTLIQEAVGTF